VRFRRALKVAVVSRITGISGGSRTALESHALPTPAETYNRTAPRLETMQVISGPAELHSPLSAR